MDPSAKPLSLLLHDLRSPINIGMLLRVAETYNVDVAVIGNEALFEDPEKVRIVSDFACGALERKGFRRYQDLAAATFALAGRRLIATSIQSNSERLPNFSFRSGDIVVLGNEYDGLPEAAMESCAASVYIPMADVWTPKPRSHHPIDGDRLAPVARDGQPNLNVAMAGGIICYQWFVGSQARTR